MSDYIRTDSLMIKELEERLQKLESKAAKRKQKQAEKEEAKAAKKAAAAKDLEQYDTLSEPRKSLSTFMRNQNKLYVNAINVIDRKAAIMIRINSTIISAFVIFFQHIQSIPYGVFIGIIMIIFSFISLMLAINASRPHLFQVLKAYTENILPKYKKTEEGMFTIGVNADISLDEYEAAFEKVVNSQSLQIGNQVRRMYLFEKQQRMAFTRIELSYLAFMAGFSIAVITFIIGALQNHLI